MLTHRALPDGRLTALGATRDFCHGLPAGSRAPESALLTRIRSSILAAAAGVAAGALGALPWFAGLFIVVEPGLARAFMIAGAAGGAAAVLAAAALRQGHPAVRATVLAVGVLAAASGPVLFHTVADRTPAEPRPAGRTGSAAPAPVPDRLRLLQVSVDHGYPDPGRRLPGRSRPADRRIRADRLAADIRRLGPDVIVLREAWCAVGEGCLVDRLARELGLHTVYAQANGSLRWLGFETGSAILSRFPIGGPGIWPLAAGRDAGERGIALFARIDHPDLPFDLVGVDLASSGDAGSAAGARTADLLDRILAAPERPVLVVGDLNLPGRRAALGRFREAGYRDLQGSDLENSGGNHVLVDAAAGWRPLRIESPRPRRTMPPAGGVSAGRSEGAGGHVDHPPGILVELQLPVPPGNDNWTGAWRTASAAEAGFDPGRLATALDRIGELDGLQGVLVARHGRLVAEHYFRGAAGHRPHNLKSASKSVLSALAGLAAAQGLLDLDQPIAGVLPAAAELDDPGKRAITVRHLLTMTSGLESTSFDNYGSWVASPNWVRAALMQPLQAAPGTRFSYSTGDTHLLSAVLARAVGKGAHAFAREQLFAPLGIRRSAWARDRQGIDMGGNNLLLLPRDMLKFGQLYLNRGRWAGKQLLPWQWVDESTRPGLVGPRQGGRIYGGYGYLWWLRGPRERGAYVASGYGGQYIYVSPAEDIVVVVISTEVSKGRSWRNELFGIVRRGIAGSVLDPYERRPAPKDRLPVKSAGGYSRRSAARNPRGPGP